MSGANGSLPNGWSRVPLAELCLFVAKTDPKASPDEEFDYIDISSIDRVKKSIVAPKRLRGDEAPSRARQVVEEGDVIFSTVRPNLQTIARVPLGLRSPIASTGFCVLRPVSGVHSDFLFYSLLSDDFQSRVLAKARGVSYPAVRDPDILSEPLLVPPMEEQKRIVERLDSLLSELRNGIECFERALRGLGEFRTACLAAAFHGDTQELTELAVIQSGIAKGRPKDEPLAEVPYIRTANVQALRLDLTEVKTLQVTQQQRARHQLGLDDVLVLEGGDADKVGRGWIWSGEVADCLHQNHVFAVRTNKELLHPRYLAYYVNAPQARRYFLSVAKQTVNLASINKANLSALPVPRCSMAEQQRIVARLDEQRTATTAMEGDLRRRLNEAELLRRSLLHAAVNGDLARQDARDGSVQAMLARAAMERRECLSKATTSRKNTRAALPVE